MTVVTMENLDCGSPVLVYLGSVGLVLGVKYPGAPYPDPALGETLVKASVWKWLH